MTPYCIIHHWYVDFSVGTLTHKNTGEQRRLGEFQIRLLQVLAEHAGEILSRDELNQLVWERRVIGNNSLPNAIHALRVALEDDGKQQKIIKTIPKKGYILEKEYCQFVPVPELDDVEENPFFNRLPAQSIAPEAPATDSQLLDNPPAVVASGRAPVWRWLVPIQGVLLLVILAWIVWPYVTPPAQQLKKNDATVYSNIRLQELVTRGEPSAGIELNKQLGPTLFMLNQHLKNQDVTMDVVYAFDGTSLNYTLTLKNACGQKQLAMKVLNWRTNSNVLSALIYRETERKFNEMANCVN